MGYLIPNWERDRRKRNNRVVCERKRSGFGKVTMTVQEKFCEFNAITTADYTLKTGLYVRIVAVDESGTLVVEPLGNSSRDAD